MGSDLSMRKEHKKAKLSAVVRRSLTWENVPVVKRLNQDRPRLSDTQIQLLQSTWAIVQGDIAKLGISTFVGMFESHPDVLQIFVPFKNLTVEDLQYSIELRKHACRVMSSVDKMLEMTNDENELVDYLHDIGCKHATYNAKFEYIDLIGPQFIFAIQPMLKDHWTPEVEQAWSDFFKYIAYGMKEAML